MISVGARGCGLSVYTKAVSQSVGGRHVLPPLTSLLSNDAEREHHDPPILPHYAQNNTIHADHDHGPPITPYYAQHQHIHIHAHPKPIPLTGHSLAKTLISKPLRVSSGIGVTQVRCAHTDIKIPDFSAYRRPSTMNPTKRNDETIDSRRAFTYLMTSGFGVAGACAAKGIVQGIIGNLAAAKDVLALAKIEVDLSSIPEGKNMVFKWRGKPLFVRHRTAEEIAREKAVDWKSLRDPQPDEDRTRNPSWLVVIGVCTHLGCVPIANQGDYFGYYCPCHGSHYDGAGRIRKGPAPLNLEIPEHEFDGDQLVVG